MAQLPPDYYYFIPPPHPPPSPKPPSHGRIIALVVIDVVTSLLVTIIVCSLRDRLARAAVAASAAVAAWTRPLPEPSVRDDERQLYRAHAASRAAGLPAFTYSRSVKHNVTGAGEEAAASCSVCLAAFQLGETVRLLPACLQLYHVECIDPWLDAHSTCPLCRSDTDPTVDVPKLPPV